MHVTIFFLFILSKLHFPHNMVYTLKRSWYTVQPFVPLREDELYAACGLNLEEEDTRYLVKQMDIAMETMDNKVDKDQTEVDFKIEEDFKIEVEEMDFKIGMEEGQDLKIGLIV